MSLQDKILGIDDSDRDVEELEAEMQRWANRMNRYLETIPVRVETRTRRQPKRPPQKPFMGVKR